MIDGTGKAEIPSKFAKRTARHNEFRYNSAANFGWQRLKQVNKRDVMHFSSSLNVGIRGERVYVDKNGDAEKILFLLDMRWPNTCELYLLTIFFSLCYYYNYY